MNFTALLGIIPTISKAGFLLNPELIKAIFTLILSAVLVAESVGKKASGEEQKKLAIDTIQKFYNTIDILVPLPIDVDKFVKEELIPKGIDLVVFVIKQLNLFQVDKKELEKMKLN